MFVDLQLGNLHEPISGRSWDKRTIYDKFWHRVNSLKSQGLSASDRILIHYGNNLEFFVDLLAIWNLGGSAIPIDSRLTAFEVENLARLTQPRFSLWGELIDESVGVTLNGIGVKIIQADSTHHLSKSSSPTPLGSQFSLDHEAMILFTSGTTGQPKGVVHTHRTLRARWMSLRENLGLKRFRRTLCLLPTHFGHGLICNCLFPWLSGQDLFILPAFRPEIIMQLGSIIDAYKITFMSSVPPVWRLALKLTKSPKECTLEQVHCGSAPLSGNLWKEIMQWTGTDNVLNAYGITETGSWVAGTTIEDFQPDDGLIGKPWGAVIKVLKSGTTDITPVEAEECKPSEQGYIWINTPALMQGYFGRDDLTNKVVAQGWFLTGDIGLIDDRGLLYLRGRERDEINKGGMKIFPSDIDAVVERFAGVVDVCAFGFTEELYGEDVGVAIVMQKSDNHALQELYKWTRQHLAEHQMPRRWFLLSEIPRTSRGKVSRVQVAETCSHLSPIGKDRLKAI